MQNDSMASVHSVRERDIKRERERERESVCEKWIYALEAVCPDWAN